RALPGFAAASVVTRSGSEKSQLLIHPHPSPLPLAWERGLDCWGTRRRLQLDVAEPNRAGAFEYQVQLYQLRAFAARSEDQVASRFSVDARSGRLAIMAKESAGLLLFRQRDGGVEVFLVHPGGPFWARKDTHAWSIPKGEIDPGEDALQAARREFTEETGLDINGDFVALAPRKQPGGKIVRAWAV